ncbi:uncharacterized protein B0I36DRAFT_318350, partial [Microdochium trichocladiopsis]
MHASLPTACHPRDRQQAPFSNTHVRTQPSHRRPDQTRHQPGQPVSQLLSQLLSQSILPVAQRVTVHGQPRKHTSSLPLPFLSASLPARSARQARAQAPRIVDGPSPAPPILPPRPQNHDGNLIFSMPCRLDNSAPSPCHFQTTRSPRFPSLHVFLSLLFPPLTTPPPFSSVWRQLSRVLYFFLFANQYL